MIGGRFLSAAASRLVKTLPPRGHQLKLRKLEGRLVGYLRIRITYKYYVYIYVYIIRISRNNFFLILNLSKFLQKFL